MLCMAVRSRNVIGRGGGWRPRSFRVPFFFLFFLFCIFVLSRFTTFCSSLPVLSLFVFWFSFTRVFCFLAPLLLLLLLLLPLVSHLVHLPSMFPEPVVSLSLVFALPLSVARVGQPPVHVHGGRGGPSQAPSCSLPEAPAPRGKGRASRRPRPPLRQRRGEYLRAPSADYLQIIPTAVHDLQ